MQETLFDLGAVGPSVQPAATASQALPEKPIQTTFWIAGIPHWCGQGFLKTLATGDLVTLSREPANQFDANAIRIQRQGRMLGYVPRAVAGDLAPVMDAGGQARGLIDIIEPGSEPRFWKVRMVARVALPAPEGGISA